MGQHEMPALLLDFWVWLCKTLLNLFHQNTFAMLSSLLFVIVCSFCTLASVTMVKDQPQLEMGNISQFLNKQENFEQEQAFEVAELWINYEQNKVCKAVYRWLARTPLVLKISLACPCLAAGIWNLKANSLWTTWMCWTGLVFECLRYLRNQQVP